jgi:hypothetical protein
VGASPLARAEGIISERVDEELVIYDTHNQTAHALTAAAASVWEHCDGRRSAEQIARELHLGHAIVAQAVAELNECGLLAEAPPDGVSRRIALRRIAKAGGAAIIGAPLISTVVILPASAASSPPTCAISGSICDIFWDNGDCSGPPALDDCSSFSTSCSCTPTAACEVESSVQSFRRGTCGAV